MDEIFCYVFVLERVQTSLQIDAPRGYEKVKICETDEVFCVFVGMFMTNTNTVRSARLE